MKDEAPELLPCPFCGGAAIDLGMRALVGCHKCALARRDAQSWNTRADLPPTRAAALAVPEVKALFDAAFDYLFWDVQLQTGKDDGPRETAIRTSKAHKAKEELRTALAALRAASEKE